ncbi:MAG: hypothetical protein JSS56_03505 [Proteobacteria bacterium]|nr:hypothetical protein [Pseudomonadota bacterium]
MFSSAQGILLNLDPRSANGGKNAASAIPSISLATLDDEGPPVRRLTAHEILLVSAKWKAKGRAGDENAMRVAEALEWVARRRAGETRPKPLMKVFARRISAWMGRSHSAQTH